MEKTPLPIDAVERVRAIRDRRYEETKHMTREERDCDKSRSQAKVNKIEPAVHHLSPNRHHIRRSRGYRTAGHSNSFGSLLEFDLYRPRPLPKEHQPAKRHREH